MKLLFFIDYTRMEFFKGMVYLKELGIISFLLSNMVMLFYIDLPSHLFYCIF